ncbi:hypothetical protein N7493_005192 [Penicillium malachiteum]|uniref:Uncharacterized protein n=1 Tax=Penicillium malachiteum TaxID=1324776 RepID=A0AAD6HMI6_9EURO|nr:hypothetical protein N7493_005192 [Penicillium malachiteum]
MEFIDPGRSAFTWSTQEVGYFDPKTDPKEDLPHIDSKRHDFNLIFQNVNAFISHIRGILVFKDEITIRTNIHLCLRGTALEWYIAELTDQDRENLRLNEVESPNGWLQKLDRRFSLSSNLCRMRLTTGSGVSSNACEAAHQLIRYAQILGIHNTHDQLSLILKYFNLDRNFENLHRLLTKPSCGTSIEEFMRILYVTEQENKVMNEWSMNGFDSYFIEEEPKKQQS